MNILAYQTEDGVYRFIYSKPSGNLDIVSVEDYSGMSTFLKYSGATRIDKDVDIYEYIKDIEGAV